MAITRADRDVGGLCVLGLLLAGPKHPYEMHRMMVDTRKDFVTGLPRSMYHAVERLEKAGHIEPVATVRDGSKPERTVYAITASGRQEVRERLIRLLAQPDADSVLFIAALSFLVCVPPKLAVGALSTRLQALTSRIAQLEADLAEVPKNLPPVLLVETEYELATARSQQAWVRELLDRIEGGDLPWPADHTKLAALHSGGKEDGPDRTPQ